VIENFRHKGLRRLYENGDRRGLPPELIDRIGVILADLEVARQISDLDRPGFRLHSLKGDLKGFWSITVRANWRIIFRFEDTNAFDVNFLDYH
jgi:proteic killer suppression protein